jgi:DNA-binding transcriptional regulator/RsmH inhibitor MraZ
MEHNYERYMGDKSLRMDPKNRVSIQSSWRPEAGTPLYLQPGENNGLTFLKVLSQEAYRELMQRINETNKSPVEKHELRSWLAQSCRDASINEQGRLLVPKEVGEKVGIVADSDVVLLGCGIHFEIWSKENYEKKLAARKARLAALDDIGIFA